MADGILGVVTDTSFQVKLEPIRTGVNLWRKSSCLLSKFLTVCTRYLSVCVSIF